MEKRGLKVNRNNLYKWAACALLVFSLCSAQIIAGIHPFLMTGRTQEASLPEEENTTEKNAAEVLPDTDSRSGEETGNSITDTSDLTDADEPSSVKETELQAAESVEKETQSEFAPEQQAEFRDSTGQETETTAADDENPETGEDASDNQKEQSGSVQSEASDDVLPAQSEDASEEAFGSQAESVDEKEALTEAEDETEGETESKAMFRMPKLAATAETKKVTINRSSRYDYSSYGFGSYVTYEYLVTVPGIAGGAYGFCANPAYDSPSSGTYSVKDDGFNMARIMYYGLEEYSGDQCWFVQKGHSGFSDGKRYIVIHLAVALHNNSDSLGTGANSTVLGYAKQLREYALSQPGPFDASLSLSKTELKASWQGNTQVTEQTTLNGDPLNYISITLPAGMSLVNKSENKTYGPGQKAVVHGGQTFYFTGAADQASISGAGWSSGTLSGQKSMSIKAYRIQAQQAGKQDLVFLTTDEKVSSVALTVTWNSAQGRLRIHKSAEGISLQAYDMKDAEYTVYADQALTKAVTVIRVDEAGNGTADGLAAGDYYVKETRSPANGAFTEDASVYKVTVIAEKETLLEVKDTYKTGKLIIKKSSLPKGLADKWALTGAVYAVYSDKALSGMAGEAVIAETGEGSVSDLPFGTYYVKETKAPDSGMYLMDEAVHEVTVSAQTPEVTLEVTDETAKGSVKILKDAEKNADGEEPVEGIRFILTYNDPSMSIEDVAVTTDEYGVALAEGLIPGKWTLREDPATVPDGYIPVGGFIINLTPEAIAAREVYIISCTNRIRKQGLCIRKKDAETGCPLEGAVFEVRKPDGNALELTPDGSDKSMKEFTTDKNGEIHITKSLPAGKYTVRELKAPEGYELPENPEMEIQITGRMNETVEAEFSDHALTGLLRVTKIDKETGKHAGSGF